MLRSTYIEGAVESAGTAVLRTANDSYGNTRPEEHDVIAALLDVPISVTLRKIGQRGPGSRWPRGAVFTGILVTEPRVGEHLAVFESLGNRRIVTSAVIRVLRDETCTYVQTEHSVYRITFG
jgi:hypothetical protein